MIDKKPGDSVAGVALAKKLAEEEEGVGRKPSGPTRFVIPAIAVVWSLFQLSIASWWTLDSTFIRAIHLGFALLIVFLNFPMLKTPWLGLTFLSTKRRIPLIDYPIAIFACVSALYIAIDYVGMTERYGTGTAGGSRGGGTADPSP